QFGELEKQVREVAFDVDDDARDAVDGGFFEQGEAEAGLAGAGHADDDAVGQQVAGVIHHRRRVGPRGVGGEDVLRAEVEAGGALDIERFVSHVDVPRGDLREIL